ncbi:VanZ family protein [Marinobacter lipolyticus]|uniref:VanZ family protein n=1 Tax=Marinobacter lipolyticus TaxID=209639 RepID=UPI003A8EA69E
MDTHKGRLEQILDCRPLWQLALLISVIAILYLATTSQPYPLPSSPNDKINHLIAFTELTILARLGWPRMPGIWLVVGLCLYGLAIELVQSQLPYREFSMADLIADAAGIAIGLLPWPGLRRGVRTPE